jgi:hypothetical protein
MGNIPLNTRPISPSLRTGSPISRAKLSSTRTRVVSPSQRGLTSASTSQLPLNPSLTPTKSSFETQRRPFIDATRPSVDVPRHTSIDAPRRLSIDTPRRPPVDSTHQPSDSLKTSRATSPSTPVRSRAASPNANSAAYAHNRHFNTSPSSLALTPTPEQRELIRSATSILCKEMRKAPPRDSRRSC